MIKKIMIALVALVGLTAVASAKDTYSRDASVLPKAAQTLLAANFKAKVNIIKIEKDFGRVSEYEVILTDGTEVTFDRNGNWDNIEVGAAGSVPAKFLPQGISTYVKANHKGARIVGIDKERSGYEVELSDGIELKFNKQGQFLRYDR